ncbi:glycosyltransferase [Nakamurella sp. YIM 132087]|uniref:Glycosyltransferase n=1 Tax=Nakamurella alba TaxID=2665158 RepID=A0A7K1FJL7_9ACTN|nr:glycosyltransferase family 4 protein [Nakamurella alba]MTD14321.1 glycosyltransferase [Nakamurella alba]
MRIAFVCADPGIPVFGTKGASLHARAVIGEFRRAGHDVRVVAVRPDGGPADVGVHRLPAVPAGSGITVADRELAAMAADRAVADALEDIDPDLVYERYSLWGRTATDWARRHRRPSVLEVNAPLVQEQQLHRSLVHTAVAEECAVAALSAASVVVCVSDPVADWARERGADPLVVPNGVDVQRISPRSGPVTPADAGRFVVGFAGSLKPWHGVEVLLEAVARLHRSDRRWAALVVGDGPRRVALAGSAAASDLGTALEFNGAVPADAVVTQLRRMDIACAPYPVAQDQYFSPLKVYEYLAAGLPVVASGVGQLPAALDHGRLGVLVPPGDPAALALALHRLRSDTALRTDLARRGRARAVAAHTWADVVRRSLAPLGGLVRGDGIRSTA